MMLRFLRHPGNEDVVRQELAAERGIKVSLRGVEREVMPLRRELVAEARATLRFEGRRFLARHPNAVKPVS